MAGKTKDHKITARQLMFLIITNRAVISLVTLPVIVTTNVGRDAWISAILATLAGLLLTWIPVTLAMRFPRLSLVEICHEVLGKYLGTIFALIFIGFFFHVSTLMIRIFGEFLTTAAMPETPIEVFIIFMMLAVAYVIFQGIEVLVRVNEVIVPVLLASIVFILVLVAKDVDLSNLKPYFEYGGMLIVLGSITPIAWFSDFVVMNMITPNVNQTGEIRRAFIIGILIDGAILVLVTSAVLGVFGATEAHSLSFPTFSLAKMISVGEFLERLEAILVAVWISGIFIKSALFLYSAATGISQLLSLKDYKPVVWPLVTILVPLSLYLFENLVEIKEFFKPGFWGIYVPSITVLLPLFLILVSVLRGKAMKVAQPAEMGKEGS